MEKETKREREEERLIKCAEMSAINGQAKNKRNEALTTPHGAALPKRDRQ